ncbi:hypothetical protein BLNAU_8276 [Blattamonas nauphoetae]|uniref:Uncharacterized protein n=1 Tax=Blattamonas nauphoetae TaxID=2049346 RepID=A0ABQ9XZ82_9EUKA|nr:hypothetical protein BLNAU_8276 [Blattamonas nauphoetae]
MPPKHQLGENCRTTQHSPQTDSLEISNESSLDSQPIPAPTDLLTITPKDHQYIQISKHILQYEMKLKRINIETISEQTPQDVDEITLPTTAMSDRILVLQDSISQEDLLKGCISLFEQVNSGQNLTPVEVIHASRFLKYSGTHMKHRGTPHNKLLETILSEDVTGQTKHTSALIKLVCHPSDTLQMAALSSLDYAFSTLSKQFYVQVSVTDLHSFLRETRTELVEELASILGLDSADEAELCLHSDRRNRKPNYAWLNGFERLLGLVGDGRRFFDLGMLAVVDFLSNRPNQLELFFYSKDNFGLKINNEIVSSSPLDAKSLWKLFTPTQPQLAAIILTAFRKFMDHEDSVTFMKHIWNDWFPCFVNAVDPSKLPFTVEFIPFHNNLIELLSDHLAKMEQFQFSRPSTWTDQLQGELDEAYRAFYTHTTDYVVHLSLHPFAHDNERSDKIVEFLGSSYLRDYGNSLLKANQEELRKAMDASALSSSSPPFILTSQLVCRLTDDEIIDIVDRIVALLDSDSPLDDDIILRICAFHKHQLSRIYLPDLFRNAGRSPTQYFHALECLLFLPIDYLDQAPINYLLTTRRNEKTTMDEWHDVDLETVGIAKRMINRTYLSVVSKSKERNQILLDLVIRYLTHIHRHCASRLCQSQFERLLAPSVDVLSHYFIQPSDFGSGEGVDRKALFVPICRLCDQRVIAEHLNRTGFFSHFVTGLLNPSFEASKYFFRMIVDRSVFPKLNIDDRRKIRRTVPHLLEEGWQDVMEYNFVQGCDVNVVNVQYRIRPMMQDLGGNVNWLYG